MVIYMDWKNGLLGFWKLFWNKPTTNYEVFVFRDRSWLHARGIQYCIQQ